MENDYGRFENWWAAAELYCSEHPELDFWDFQVQEFASDIAWRMEGVPFTEKAMNNAFEDWINGGSPYSKRSRDRANTPEEGYDWRGQWDRDESKTRLQMSQFALGNGVPMNLLHDFISYAGAYTNHFFNEDDAKYALKQWKEANGN